MFNISQSLYRFFGMKSCFLNGVKKIPRHTKKDIYINQKRLAIIDSLSFVYQYKDIFEKKIYDFKSKSNSPLIIDCGSNIGLSILFFKQIYPESRILGFEPDPDIFLVLKKNIERNGCNHVELINKAVWVNEEILEFIPDGSDGGRIPSTDSTEDVEKKSISVPAACLKNYLNENIDFLKIDIEGAETAVLQSCKEKLGNIENIFIEYHSIANKKQDLHHLLNILSENGFRIHIHSVSKNFQPFIKKEVENFYDMQLNIFAFRES